MNEPTIYLIEMQGKANEETAATALKVALGVLPMDLTYDADGDGRVTIKDALTYLEAPITYRFCSSHHERGYMSLPTDDPPNAYYEPRVVQPGLFRQDLYSPGATSGKSSGSAGEIVLINTDGELDHFVDYGFDARSCVVKKGCPSWPLSRFQIVNTGTLGSCEVGWTTVVANWRDRSAELDTPIQIYKYAGNNVLPDGLEGGSELFGKYKPVIIGACDNLSPVLVNSSRLIYQVNAGAVDSVPGCYDSGAALTQGAAYANQADMETTAPNPGEYRVWPAGGYFRLGSSPSGAVTCDVIQDPTVTAAQACKSLVSDKLGASAVVEQSIITLDTVAPFKVGIYTGTDGMNVSTALDQVGASVGAGWGFDNHGLFWIQQLTAPDAATAVMTLELSSDDVEIERTSTADGDNGLPIWRVTVKYGKNWTVQNSGLAGSVSSNQLTFDDGTTTPLTADRRNLLAMEYLAVVAENPDVKTLHPLAGEITVETLLVSAADAQALADSILELRSVRRDRLTVSMPAKLIAYPVNGAWDDQAITEMPSARQFHAVTEHAGDIYVVGGITLGIYQASVIKLSTNALNGPWESDALPNLITGATAYHSVEVYNGFLYVFAGQHGKTAMTNDAYRIDLSNPVAWDYAGVTNLPMAGPCSTCMVGSIVYAHIGNKVAFLNLDTPTAAWTLLPDTTFDFSLMSAIGTYNNWLYVASQTDGPASIGFQRLYLPNPVSWSAISPSVPSGYLRGLQVGSKLYLFGSAAPGAAVKNYMLDLSKVAPELEPPDFADIYYRTGSGSVFAADHLFSIGGMISSTTELPNTFMLRTNANADDIAHLTSLGRTAILKTSRYGYNAGRPMIIIGPESDLQNNHLKIDYWG